MCFDILKVQKHVGNLKDGVISKLNVANSDSLTNSETVSIQNCGPVSQFVRHLPHKFGFSCRQQCVKLPTIMQTKTIAKIDCVVHGDDSDRVRTSIRSKTHSLSPSLLSVY